jgi:hypothetical protein
MNVAKSRDARNSIDISKNKVVIQGANSIRNVANSRDASSNKVRQKQHGRTHAKTGTTYREPTALRTSATAGMPAATRCARNSMEGHKQKQGLHTGANSIKKVSNSRDASSNMNVAICRDASSNMNVANSRDASSNKVHRNSMVASKNKDFMQGATAIRTLPIAGMPAATRCARNSMEGHTQKQGLHTGANSIKNVNNSRDASSNMVRHKQHGYKQKQGLHAGSQQQQERRQLQG